MNTAIQVIRAILPYVGKPEYYTGRKFQLKIFVWIINWLKCKSLCITEFVILYLLQIGSRNWALLQSVWFQVEVPVSVKE